MIYAQQHLDVALYLLRAKSVYFPKVQGVNSTLSYEVWESAARSFVRGGKKKQTQVKRRRFRDKSLLFG